MSFYDPNNAGNVVGRLGWEVRLEKVGAIEKCVLNVACSRNYKDKKTGEYPTDWVRIDAIGENAKRAATILKKRDLVHVTYSVRSWTKKGEDGKNRNMMSLDLVEFRKLSYGKAEDKPETIAAAASAPATDDAPVEDVPF